MSDKNKAHWSWIFNWLDTPLRTKLRVTIITLLVLFIILGIWVSSSFHWWTASNYITKYTPNPASTMRDIVWLVGSVIGGSLAILGFVNALHRTQQKDLEIAQKDLELKLLEKKSKDERISQRRQTDTEIFARSVEQLGHEEQAIRLGGLYSLENLARTARERTESTNNYAFLNSLLETLSAFVRMSAPIPPKDEQHEDDRVATDVEAAIRIISRTYGYDLRKEIKVDVDLRNCYLPKLEMPNGADMRGFELDNSILSQSRLWNISLNFTSLHNTVFIGADLEGAFIRESSLLGANLHGARLNNVDISATSLENTDLSQVEFIDARMEKTNLTRCCLDGADLRDANLSSSTLWQTSVAGAAFQGVILTKTNLNTVINITQQHINSAFWDPEHPPISSINKKLESSIKARTKEIRKQGLWEKYLAKREKNETS